MSIQQLFPSTIYLSSLTPGGAKKFNEEMLKEAYQIQRSDIAGQKWSKKNYPGGYTSYASMNRLHEFSSTFAEFKKKLDPHVISFFKELEMDIPFKELKLTDLWINIMPKLAAHSMHIHPLSIISGTYYLKTPKNCSGLKFEDPKLLSLMGSPPRKTKAKIENQRFISIPAKAGHLILFESYMRHEVSPNLTSQDRVSLSFNYDWVR